MYVLQRAVGNLLEPLKLCEHLFHHLTEADLDVSHSSKIFSMFHRRNKARGFATLHSKSGWNDKIITGRCMQKGQVCIIVS